MQLRKFAVIGWMALSVFSMDQLASGKSAGAGGSADDSTRRDAAYVTSSQTITPLAAPGSKLLALETHLRKDENANGGYAVTTALSPDGTKLLVLISGSNGG